MNKAKLLSKGLEDVLSLTYFYPVLVSIVLDGFTYFEYLERWTKS